MLIFVAIIASSVEPSSSALPAKTSIPPIPSAPSISSAPTVEDFQPPLPTPQDPYPGYYQLPSGSWAAYDPKYYKAFWDNWQTDFTSTGELDEGKKRGKGKGKVQMEGLQSVDAATELENGRLAELEKKKNLTTGILANAAALQQPRMAIRVRFHRAIIVDYS
jgi:proline-rich protein PRCC